MIYIEGRQISLESAGILLEHSRKELRELGKFITLWFDDKPTITVFSSGTTGQQKAIELRKSSLTYSALQTGQYFEFNASSRLLLCLNPKYIAGKMMVVRALTWGCELHVSDNFSSPFQGVSGSFDFCAMVSYQLRSALNDAKGSPLPCNTILLGGGILDSELEQAIVQKGSFNCFQSYAMTETASHVALRKVGETPSLYTGLGDVSFGINSTDCLTITSLGLNLKDFETQDIVELISPRSFRWKGRADNQISSGGIKVQLEEVDKIASSIIDVPCFAWWVPDESLGQKLILVLESERYDPARETELKQRLQNLLPRYHSPREFRYKSVFDRTETGKIIRTL